MAEMTRCTRCGRSLPSDRADSVCADCLRTAGVASDPAPGTEESAGNDVTFAFNPSAPGSVLESIAQSIGPVPRVVLREMATDGSGMELIKTSSDQMPAPGERGNRYQLFGEIARGGMGAILKGRDPNLGRDLAVKVLLESHQDEPEMVRRFVEEAQIGGQLQHPGIVPVYELGTFDRRPYFTMKLVKGRTLASLLAERSAAQKAPATSSARPGSDGGSRPLDPDLPRFLGIFESVCQTMSYAHARGVIHRDLKPANVMVGSFGEVQVMDWGLAKVLREAGGALAQPAERAQNLSVIATVRSGSMADDSQVGSVLGTPAYMAPEQASGEIDRVDRRADVFGLGSILCELLTGQPAYTGRNQPEIVRKAMRGDTADAFRRLDACAAEPELIALAKNCLAIEPDDRPRDAGVVAERMTDYLAGVQEKLRRVELDRVEERSRRRLTTVAALAVIVLGLFGGAAFLWNREQRLQRIAGLTRAVDESLAEAARLRGEAQAAPPGELARWTEALSAAKRAQGLLAGGESESSLRLRVTTLLDQLERERTEADQKARRLDADRVLLVGLESVRGNRAEHMDPKKADLEYAAVFRKAGLDLDATQPAQAGLWLRARSEPQELAGYLDDWAFVRMRAERSPGDWQRLVAAAQAADPDPWRDAVRSKAGSHDPAALAELDRLASDTALEAQPAASLILLANQLKFGRRDRDAATKVLRRAASLHPADYWVHFELALAPGADSGEPRKMYPRPEEALRHLSAAVAIRPRSSPAHNNLGIALAVQGRHEEAADEYRTAIRLKPDSPDAHNNLGAALTVLGKLDLALAEYRTAIELDPDFVQAHMGMGAIFCDRLRDYPAAEREFRTAIRLGTEFADSHSNLGIALFRQDKLEPAMAEFRTAIQLEPDLAHAHANFAIALEQHGDFDQAIAEFRAAIRLEPDVAQTHLGLGALLFERARDFPAAENEFRTSIRLEPREPKAHANLGFALKAQRKLSEALDAFRQAAKLAPPRSRMARDMPGMIREIEEQLAKKGRPPAT
jgi:eukaryotic-like serine/threonine-protein kinase